MNATNRLRLIGKFLLGQKPALIGKQIQKSRIFVRFSRCIGSIVSRIARSQSAAFSHGSTWNMMSSEPVLVVALNGQFYRRIWGSGARDGSEARGIPTIHSR